MHWVVGSGIAGLCLARELRLRGREVTLCGPSTDASASRAAGGLLQICGGRLNAAHLRLRQEAFEYFPGFLDSFEAHRNLLEYSDSGHLRLATNPNEVKGLRNFTSTLNSMGLRLRWLERSSLQQLESELSTQILGACFMPDARVSVGSLLRALNESLESLGVNRDYRELENLSLKERLELQFSDGSSEIIGNRITLACGAATDNLLPSELTTYQGRTSSGVSCWFAAPRISLSRTLAVKSEPFCLLPNSDRWCFSGGEQIAAEEFLGQVFQSEVPIADLDIRRGTRVQAPDGLPVAGETRDPRVSLLTGLGRNGFLTAPYLARLMATENRASLVPFSPQRPGVARDLRGAS